MAPTSIRTRRSVVVTAARVLRNALLVTGPWLATGAAPGRAQTRTEVPDLSRWENGTVHEAWTVKDGLPVNSINDLLQSRDGYIWAATFDGVVRFDGVRFTVFSPATHQGLTSGRFLNLTESLDGTIWLGTEWTVVRLREGRFLEIGAAEGLDGKPLAIYEDRSGRTWVMTSTTLGLMEGDRFVPVRGELPGGVVTRLIQRADGSLWAGTDGAGLYRLEGSPETGELRAVLVDPLGGAGARALFPGTATSARRR